MFSPTVEDVKRMASIRVNKVEQLINPEYGRPTPIGGNYEPVAVDTDVVRSVLNEIIELTRELDRLTGPQ